MHHGDPEGDIVGSYSGDRICDGKPVRTPFHLRGGLWVCVSSWGELARRLSPRSTGLVRSSATTYSGKTGGEQKRPRMQGTIRTASITV